MEAIFAHFARFVHKKGSPWGAVLMEMDVFESIFYYFDKIEPFFWHFGLSNFFTAEMAIFALMTIARKIMMVISPFLMVRKVMQSSKILPSGVTKPNIAFKNGKEIAACFT